MIFSETKLSGAYVIEIEKNEDERGFFARVWDKNEFSIRGLAVEYVQCSISFNRLKGTIRGMHYQTDVPEEKIIMCTKGSIFDVIIDLRENSPTFKKWFSIKLSSDNHTILYVPKGFAHGFQTLENNTQIFYQISEFYNPDSAKGIIWNDSELNIKWPLPITSISARDKSFPSLELSERL